jgi:hypothetical protein
LPVRTRGAALTLSHLVAASYEFVRPAERGRVGVHDERFTLEVRPRGAGQAAHVLGLPALRPGLGRRRSRWGILAMFPGHVARLVPSPHPI